jgi:hypothetical protein
MALVVLFVCLICFKLHEQFFSYLATVTITGDRAANFDLCLALTTFRREGSFTCHTYCDTGPPFLRSYPKDPWFSLLNAVHLAKEQSLPILNVLGLTRPAREGLELATFWMLSESTTTRLPQPLMMLFEYSTINKQTPSFWGVPKLKVQHVSSYIIRSLVSIDHENPWWHCRKLVQFEISTPHQKLKLFTSSWQSPKRLIQ